MSDLNNQLKEALVEALDELFNAEDVAHSHKLIDTITEIRGDLNLIMMTDDYAEKHVWDKLRNVTSNIQTLMTTTATFVQAIDDIDVAIKKFVGAFVPFTNKTAIVDNETLKKAVEHTELEQVLLNNYWLFFLMYAATNMRVVNAYLSTLIPKGKGRGAKDGA
jgi:hypothetical protein